MISFFFFSSRRRHTRLTCDWSSDVCSSDLGRGPRLGQEHRELVPTETGDDVAGAQHAAQRARHRAQHGIAREVAQAVVYQLEVVEIEVGDREGMDVASGPRDL